MSYKGICPNCKGNGYITMKVKDHNLKWANKKNEIIQCLTCKSEGEVTYDKKINDRICDTYYHKRMH